MTRRAPAFALCILVSFSAAAQIPRNEVAIAVGWADFADLGGAQALGASYSHFWTPAVSTQLGAFLAGDRISDARLIESFTDVHAAAAFHPLRERIVSPWLGFGIAFVAIDSERSDSRFTTIANAGVDLNISRRFAIGGEVHYSPFEVDPRDRFGLKVNPTTFMVAVRWRY